MADFLQTVRVDEETGPVFAERSVVVTDAPDIPEPPFWGVRVKHYDVRDVFPYINETALFKNQWQLKTASQADYVRLVEEKTGVHFLSGRPERRVVETPRKAYRSVCG